MYLPPSMHCRRMTKLNSSVCETMIQVSAQTGRVHGFFLLHSCSNHSCLTNAKVPDQVQSDGCVVLHVICDMQRIFTRGLSCSTTGRDIDEQVHGSKASSIISGTSLRRDAEIFNIPLSSRLIYNLLLMVLSEQEELSDMFLEECMLPVI